ncbi:pyridoxamine 5'-phosphate oxidase family protein [Micromonospora chersina]
MPRESNAWLCTLRPDGSPHLTPVWLVYVGGTWWIGCDSRSWPWVCRRCLRAE